jgi:pimeloyl-ACP methyl ester carboxylesterase
VPITVPVRLLHGQQDPDVPWELSLRTAAALTGQDVEVTLVKDGDHRLSRPQDLLLLRRVLSALLLGQNGG